MWKEITLSGFADEIAPELSKQIEVMKRLSIGYIEMRGVDGKGLVEYTLPEAREIKKRLDEAGMRLSSVGSPIGKIGIDDPFAPHLELLKHTAEIAHIMETPNIRMFSFYIPEGEEPGKYRGEVLERLGKMRDTAAEADVVLLHENEKGIYGDIAPRCLEILQALSGEHFGGVFDFANFVQCGQNTLEAYALLRPYIDYVHVKDALSENGEVVPSGRGDGHVAEILGKLKASGYAGFLSLEPHLFNFTGFSELEKNGAGVEKKALSGEEAFTLAFEALRGILEEMK